MSVAAFLRPGSWLSDDGGPRYMQLRNRLVDGIAQNRLPPGTPLPPEREIAAITGLSRVTVRKAIEALVADRSITQKQGSGSFVSLNAPRIEQSLSRLTSFSEDMARRGMAATSRWLERGVFIPSPEEVLALALGPDASVSRITRLRLADDRPMAIERAALPTDILPRPTEVERSLYDVLDGAGLRPVRALQKISAQNLAPAEAETLGVAPGAAGLRIERMSYLADGRTAEFTQSLYRGDAYHFVAELRLAKDETS